MEVIVAENIHATDVAVSSFDATSGRDLLHRVPFEIGGSLVVADYQVATFLDLLTGKEDLVDGATEDAAGKVNHGKITIGAVTGNVDGIVYRLQTLE